MTPEELLIKRVIVENLWPGCELEVGEILIKYNDYYLPKGSNNIYDRIGESEVEPFPYLMRPLQWWEERIFVDDGYDKKWVKDFDILPQFIKSKSTGNIYKVVWYSVEKNGEVVCMVEVNGKQFFRALTDMDISTREEYNEYIKSKS